MVTEKDSVKLRELGRLPEGVLVLETDLRFATRAECEQAKKVLRARLRANETRGLLR